MLRALNNLFKDTNSEMNKLNKEYEQLSMHNQQRGSDIHESLKKKSSEFNQSKQDRKKHFDIIRNK
ncbi:hypothetical protein V7112_08780 [Bacillus sp. JJ1566]|uniref:hypothetical protein n=1 Tax=Bacillus sp. JJ1566 TaxID=3122961 RepID=UPI003000E86A